jgi:hypothetical protein
LGVDDLRKLPEPDCNDYGCTDYEESKEDGKLNSRKYRLRGCMWTSDQEFIITRASDGMG